MRRALPVLLLLVLGVILYFLFATKETPTKKSLLTQQEPASTSQKTKSKGSPTQRLASQSMQDSIAWVLANCAWPEWLCAHRSARNAVRRDPLLGGRASH